MLTVFSDYEGVVDHKYASRGQATNIEYIVKVMERLVGKTECFTASPASV